MRWHLPIAFSLLVAAPAAAVEPPSASQERELRQLKEELWPRAYREGDVVLLDRILAAEFEMIDAEGERSRKRDELAWVAAHRASYRSFRFEIERLETFENGTAVVAGRGVMVGPSSDPTGGFAYRSTNVLIRRDGRWQAIASHVSGIQPLPPEELASGRGGSAAAPALCPPPPWGREELLALPERKFAVADDAERQRLALGLVACLDEPDPRLRDEVAFSALSAWLRGKALAAATIEALGEAALARLTRPDDPAGFGRPFAALLLAEVARADRLEPVWSDERRRAAVAAAESFLGGVRDYRGFDPQQGWRHGVAHGADLVLHVGLNPRIGSAELRRLLAAVAAQVAPAGEVFYTETEPERLARAVFFIAARDGLDESFWEGWFRALGDAAPLASWSAAFESRAGLAQRHNRVAFLAAIGFAARANPSPKAERLAALADREMRRVLGG